MTMTCGLLGKKLAHSYSPAIHAAFGEGEQARYSYALFETENLQEFFDARSFHGINVTIPYKQEAMQFCDSLSHTAQEIGSVNTISRRPDGTLHGDNTDAAGFKKMVEKLAVSVSGKKVIVIGRGGSALAICYVLRELNCKIVVVSRENNNIDFLKKHGDSQILVNCTPVGMYPNTGVSPVSLDHFPHVEGVLDLIYNPARTRLMQDAERLNIPVVGGLPMLVGQAAAAYEIFIGRKVTNEDEVLQNLERSMQNIILIGMPGSGKTTHGKMLSKRLSRSFVDIDEEIEKSAGRLISDIFAKDGEEFFRKIETDMLAHFGKESGLVISTGGGCVTREENYFHLHQNGKIFFIERDIKELPREGRPLSQGNLHEMYKIRLPMYKRFADARLENICEYL
ncbi:MAG: shikimate kinase [Defluviitaleaceae bacterium]|nr:shikimate kinase [Defluviitaleaceae bacterium]